MDNDKLMTQNMFRDETERCISCINRPCNKGCPVGCDPAKFIMASKPQNKIDFIRAAAMLWSQNPLASTCGAVCSGFHCMDYCVRKEFDGSLNIPYIQKHIMEKVMASEVKPYFDKPVENNKRVFIVGGGPAGLSAAAYIRQLGFSVKIFEKEQKLGGLCRLISKRRLNESLLDNDIDFITSLGIKYELNSLIEDFTDLSKKCDKLLIATGQHMNRYLSIPGKELTVGALDFLSQPHHYQKAMVVGCGGIAMDCIDKLLQEGAESVDVIALENLGELKLDSNDLKMLFQSKVNFNARSSVIEVSKNKQGLLDCVIEKVCLRQDTKFDPVNIEPEKGNLYHVNNENIVILAIGQIGSHNESSCIMAGECLSGPSDIVDAVASGKRAAYEISKQFGLEYADCPEKAMLPGYRSLPVNLVTKVFGYSIRNPFILSASPLTDGYNRVKEAYEEGWAGAVLKTSFDGIPVRTPGGYMHCADAYSYANCDSVSERPLDIVCDDIQKLTKEYPDRLTMISTGTEMTDNDIENKRRWQSITKKAEDAGAMAVEYSMSCPGTDGVNSLALNQDINKITQVIEWILDKGNPEIPKIFKLTASVPNIGIFVDQINEIGKKYQKAKVGITVGDTLPNLIFQNRTNGSFDDAVVMGMGGKRILPINAFAITKSVNRGIPIWASGGIMSYKDTIDLLGLGVEIIQLCSYPMRYNRGIVHELESGLSSYMFFNKIDSVENLRGKVKILYFDELTEEKKIPVVNKSLCVHCGNCLTCPAQAVELDMNDIPDFNRDRCIGCSFCSQICLTGALTMDKR